MTTQNSINKIRYSINKETIKNQRKHILLIVDCISGITLSLHHWTVIFFAAFHAWWIHNSSNSTKFHVWSTFTYLNHIEHYNTGILINLWMSTQNRIIGHIYSVSPYWFYILNINFNFQTKCRQNINIHKKKHLNERIYKLKRKNNGNQNKMIKRPLEKNLLPY